ncbi:TetR/AcrR family transcriptional regulator [Enterobacter hormaechei]|uniref:TetR/AcrR family transcriptional regulator n=1 Tax=Enterobacter hormaechei TaxID=158836 RepID=UPI002739A988|nr:helix-turn-helix domain-containing protein [Enterobacter hormaechei]MDZ5680073.1 helix-turn-helix domain-containing protein [Enterobacter hormaechei]WLP09433.1 helix-turn-helix domain-containing protein [Enterobacter hormaechei]HCD9773456.1 helix-turn-helix transcriptional regulator [Enterobacter hormaechei]HCE3974307.1 helix-turn-helix transcriptional regulator [Enterobacter hormaechei]
MTTDVTRCAKKSRGRPKVFDRDAALDKAMTLFWQHGYEATSLSDLVEATGAKAPTLYAEFTNKEGLFRAVLDRYIARFAASSKEIANTVKSRHAMQEETLSTFLAQRQQRGEIPAHCRPQELAQYLSCILQGMSISAREGATLEKLQGITQTTLRLWPELLKL